MKKMFWKIYFWFLLIVLVPVYLWQGFSRIWEFIDAALMSVAMLGLFSFCWQKKWFNPIFWKIFFGIYLAWNIFQQYILPFPQIIQDVVEKDMGGLSQSVISTMNSVFFLPVYIALYFYAFRNKEALKK